MRAARVQLTGRLKVAALRRSTETLLAIGSNPATRQPVGQARPTSAMGQTLRVGAHREPSGPPQGFYVLSPSGAARLTANIGRRAMCRVKPKRKIPARVSTCRDRRLRSPVQHWDQSETANVNQVIRYNYRCLPPGAFVRFDNLERPSICSIGARSPRTIQSRLCPCWSANAIRFASLPVLSAFITASTSAVGRPSAARIRRNRRRTAFQSTVGIVVGSTMFLSSNARTEMSTSDAMA